MKYKVCKVKFSNSDNSSISYGIFGEDFFKTNSEPIFEGLEVIEVIFESDDYNEAIENLHKNEKENNVKYKVYRVPTDKIENNTDKIDAFSEELHELNLYKAAIKYGELVFETSSHEEAVKKMHENESEDFEYCIM